MPAEIGYNTVDLQNVSDGQSALAAPVSAPPKTKKKKPRKKLSAAKEGELADLQWRRYIRARDAGHLHYIDTAKTCDAYYRGDQWDDDDLEELAETGRPALTINTILPTINTMLGEQSSRRADIKFKPRKGADNDIATTLTKLYMQITDANKIDWVEQQVFSDGLIMDGRGYFDARIDFDDHIEGEIRITHKDPLDIVLDPDAKDQDPKTWNEVFETKWMTLDDIEAKYGKAQAKKLQFIAENGNGLDPDSIEYMGQVENRFGDNGFETNTLPHVDDVKSIKALRVIDRQYKKIARRDYFVDPVNGDMRPVPENWSQTKINNFVQQFQLEQLTRTEKRIRWTITCDRVVLHDEWSPYNSFTIVPYFAYFRRGRPFGVVRNLLSPQEQLNKVSSQELHIINTTANSGWTVEEGTLVGMEPDELEEHGSKTGLVLVHKRGSTPPQKIQPNTIPTGLDRVARKAEDNIKSISGINESMMGMDSPEVSGVAMEKKQNRGTLMMQVPLDNLRKTRHFLAEKVLDLIQNFYTEERVFNITNEDDPLKPREELTINQQTPEGRVVNDLTLGEYDVIIGTAPARDSYDEMQFAEALNLRQVGIDIPDDAVIEYSHLARKQELAKRVRVRTGEEPPTPEQEEILQMQQQIQMQQIQLELGKLDSEIKKIDSETELNRVKAQVAGEIDPQIRVGDLQAKHKLKAEELQLRERLSALTNQMRQGQSDTQAATKLASTAMQMANKSQEQKAPPSKTIN